MKKIVRVRKAMQGLAMALALATTVSGCSIDNANELTKENSIAYESIEETEVKDSVEEKENSSKELEDSNKETENSLDKNEIEEEANRKRIPKNGLKEDTSAEVINVDNHNYKEDYFVVMFEGQELVIPNLSRQFISQDYVKNSIIKALVLGGFDSEYSYRKTLARFYEIENYRGTAEQNVTLLNYLRHPELYLNMDLVISLDSEEKTNTEVSQNNGIQNTNGENGSNLGNEDHDDNGKDNGDHDKDKGNEKHKHSLKTEVTYEQLPDNQHRKVTTVTCKGKKNGKPCTYKKVTYGEPENCKFDKDTLECICGRKHTHEYGDEIITYVDAEGTTHTKIVSKECIYGDDTIEVSRTKSEHNFINYVVNDGTNTEKGTCECGKTDIRDIKVEHEHIEKVGTTYEQLPNNQHRKVTTTTCTGYIDGEPCTYKKVEYGEPENCKFDKDTLECICGRVHVHDWKWVKVDDENCEQVCTYDETHRGIKSPHISDGTGTVTVVPGSGTASGHDTHNDTHCTKCDEDYTITNNNVAHGSETQTEVGTPTYTQTTQDGQDGHIKTTTYKYSSCGYEYTVNGEFTVCIDNGTGSCDCGRVMTHTCNFEEIPQTLTSEEAMTYCRISKFVCSECGKEDESRTIKIPHDPYREAIPDDIFDKIGCNKCSHVLVPSIGFESDWSWEYDGVSFSLGVLSEDTYSLSSEETSSAADEVTEENVPEDTEDRQEENETQEGVSQEETTDDQTQETTDDQTQEESGEESQEDEENLGQDQGEQEQTEESQDAQESEEEENSQGKVEEATQEELKHEEEYIEKDETDLYVAYNEAVSEYLKQYSLPQNKPKALYRSERC